jgi:hypothetical protein
MQSVAYLHNTCSSPTVRPSDPSATVSVSDSCAASGSRSPESVRRTKFEDLALLPTFKKFNDGSTRERKAGQSFTTVKWAISPDEKPMEHPHTVLDCGYLCSMTLPSRLMGRLENEFRSAPTMHLAEQAARVLKRQMPGDSTVEAAVRKLQNAEGICQRMKDEYQAFSEKAQTLLAASARASSGAAASSTASVALAEIIESIWPTLRFADHAEKDAWIERTLSDPQHFIAQSYDVLDLAFAQAGIAISLAKESLYDKWATVPESERVTVDATVRSADRAYNEAKVAFTDGAIPVPESVLKGHSVIATLRDLPGDSETSGASGQSEIQPAAGRPSQRPVPPRGLPASSWEPSRPPMRRPASEPGCCVIS